MESRQPTHHGYAVDVKDRGHYTLDTGPLTDDQVQALYDVHAETFWMLAQDVGKEYGFREVYSEGRMGGWAVPVPQPSPHSVGPAIEYIPEHEMDEWERDRFRPFERDLLVLMEECLDDFRSDLIDHVDRARREPAEAAYWAARDVETI